MMLQSPLMLIPEYREYVWGGQRLRPGKLTAEAWVLFEGNQVAQGAYARQTLAQLTAQHGAQLLGEDVFRRNGTRFPLLIKLLDCAQWLSLQVHPNDAQAVELEGPGQNGKTEAWHILHAAPQAQIIAGMRPGISAERLAQAVRSGTILDEAQFLNVQTADTIFMPAGTIHALGPGLLVYEVQQVSDITYRVFDWNRPQTAARPLHIQKSLAVANPSAAGQITPLAPQLSHQNLASCAYFTLERLNLTTALEMRTEQRTFHAVTVVQGTVELEAPQGRCTLNPHQTALLPAACGSYHIHPTGNAQLLIAGAA